MKRQIPADEPPPPAAALRSSASPQIRNVATLGGNLLQRPRCWYFRSAEYHCLRKGGGHCFAISGENQYHAIFDNRPCAIVHPSTVATVLVALGAEVELTDAHGATHNLLLEDFFVPPDRDLQRENDLKPQEILTAVTLPPVPSGVRMVHLKQGEKDSFDWPLADVAVVLDLSADGTCKSADIVLGAAALEGATPLARNAYKLPLFETLIRRTILAATASG